MKKKEVVSSKRHKIVFPFLLGIMLTSCEDFLDTGAPKTLVTTPTVYASDIIAYSALAGLYSEMVNIGSFSGGGSGSIHMLAGLSADEFISSTDGLKIFELNSLNEIDIEIRTSVWEPGYKFIYYANALLEGVENSTGLSITTKKQLEGEAKFIRGFCHFYLINFFGGIPLITSTDYRTNASLSRSPVAKVYEQIVADLSDAIELLPSSYSISSNERVRPNRFAAAALLARVYLYLGDSQNAESQATNVIDQSSMYTLPDLDQVFLKESKEAIWQLKPVIPGINTNEGKTFDDRFYVSLRNSILNVFETGDARSSWIKTTKLNGIDYYHPFKYKVGLDNQPLTEYSVVLRLAEQYLIRAEARIHMNDIAGAQEDINMIRNRAGLVNTAAADKSSLLAEIEHQRQAELFSEWGHRWFDLKRWDRTDMILGTLKGSNWQATDVLYPIPQSERQNNPNLSQNNGY